MSVNHREIPFQTGAVDEARRLRVLRELELLDTPPESAFDDLADLAARFCETPSALVTLVDENRQWSKARHGADLVEIPRTASFCAHALRQSEVLIVADTALDARFANNPFVTGEPRIRFYAGAPLVMEEGEVLGTLCVFDHVPRTLTEAQLHALSLLARQVVDEIQLRRHIRELRNSEERYRAMFEQAAVGIAQVSMDGHWLRANLRLCAMVGYSEHELLHKTIHDITHPDDMAEDWRLCQLALAGHFPSFTMEKRYIHKQGHHVWVNLAVSIVRDRDGSPLYFGSVIEDISERKAVEAALRVSDERFRLLAKASNDAIWDWDLQTDLMWWNEGFGILFGYSPEETEPDSKSWTSRVHPDDGGVITSIKKALAGRDSMWSAEYRFRRKDGGYAYVHDQGYIMRNAEGKALRMIGGMSDVTQSRLNAERVAEQAALLDKAQDAIIVRSLEHRILYWNRSAERVYGWTAGEAIGRSIKELLYNNPDAFLAATATVVARGEWVGEIEQINKAGVSLTIEAHWTLVRDAAGAPKSILAINTDITERKKLETQFFRAQRMESIGTLAGGIAHDLNNLLSPIVMGVDLLMQMNPSPRHVPIIDNIGMSARRGTDLVKQVLSFARGVEGVRVTLQPEQIVREVESIIENTFPKDIRFQHEIPGSLWPVVGDPTQLNQVLLNLCVNARDAMAKGGLLVIRVQNIELDEQYSVLNRGVAAGRYVILEVTDEGCGMSPDVVERVFEPFFTTKEQGKGTGLGLSTVTGIVRSHGGFVHVYSEVGRGSTFKVYLPAGTEGSGLKQNKGTERTGLPRGNGECILLVDDEAPILDITRQTLVAFGYEVMVAGDGVQAVSLYVEHQPKIALILTDMMMPIMDGPALITAVRHINPRQRIIAASGLNANGNVARATQAGVRHFLAKPYSAEHLLTLIKTALAQPA